MTAKDTGRRIPWANSPCSLFSTLLFLLIAAIAPLGASEIDLIVSLREPVSSDRTGNGKAYIPQTQSLAKVSPAMQKWLAAHKAATIEPIIDSPEVAKASKRGGASAESKSFRVIVNSSKPLKDVIKEVSSLSGVKHVEENQRAHLTYAPTDLLYPRWHDDADMMSIRLEDAWGAQATPGASSSVKVAIIDTGVEAIHPDLTGTIDTVNSYNVAEGNNTLYDDSGHGTRIAGIIGAKADGQGMAGVAFGCKLVILDVSKYNSSQAQDVIVLSDVLSALNLGLDDDAQVDIINMSLAFSSKSVLLEQVCEIAYQKGILVVAGAGNGNQGDKLQYPASYASVLSVGALDETGEQRASFSNFNGAAAKLTDIFAPGSTIFSSIPGSQYNGTFGSGTSFSAPIVAGAAALLKTEHPDQSGAAIREHLLSTAELLPSFQPVNGQGKGRLDVENAISFPMTPNVQVVATTITDSGDHDGVMDNTETSYLVITLGTDAADALNVTGTLSTTSPAILSLGTTSTAFPDILNGFPVSNGVAFGPITIVAASPAQKIPFQLDLVGDHGFAQILSFELSIENEQTIGGVQVAYPFDASKTYRVTTDLSLRGITTIPPGTVIKVDPGVNITAHTGCVLTADGTTSEPITITSSKLEQDYSQIPPFGGTASIGPRTEQVNLALYGSNVRYVDAENGSDIGPNRGTITDPYKSLTMVFEGRAQTKGISTGTIAVLVAEGKYIGIGASPIAATGAYQVYGGFDPATWTRDIYRHPSVIDGEGVRIGIRVGAGESGLDGFVITGGSGGGIVNQYIPATPPSCVISNCFIVGNTGTSGGGLQAGDSLILRNCVFFNNEASVRGGGIYAASTANVSIANSFFIANNAPVGSAGTLNSFCLFQNSIVAGHAGTALSVGGLSSVVFKNNIAEGNVGTALKIETTAGGGTKIFNNTLSQNTNGINALQPIEMTNNIVWGNTASQVSAVSGSGQKNIIEGGFAGGFLSSTINQDPKFLGRSSYGLIVSSEFDATSNLSQVTLSPPDAFEQGQNVLITVEGEYFMLAMHENGEGTIVGDPSDGGIHEFPRRWGASFLRIATDSPAINVGVGPGGNVPVSDIDGDARAGSTTNIGADQSTPLSSFDSFRWGTFTISSISSSTELRHFFAENGQGVVSDSPNVRIDHVSFRNHNGSGFSTAHSLSDPITNSEASRNGNHGFYAPQTAIESTNAQQNFGTGIVGDLVSDSRADENGLGGIVATFSTHSIVTRNALNGFHLAGGGTNLVASENAIGIFSSGGDIIESKALSNKGDGIVLSGGGTVSSSLAQSNEGDGIVSSGSVISNSISHANQGIGITGSGNSEVSNSRVTDNATGSVSGVTSIAGCAIDGNGTGVTGIDTVVHSYIAHNRSHGAQANQISDSSIVGNDDGGVRDFSTLENSWIAGNDGPGVDGMSGLGTITNSSVVSNAGAGTINVLSASNTNIHGNGTYDAEDAHPLGSGIDRLFEGNYWGPSNTAEILGQPAAFTDYSFIRDNLDSTANPGIYIIDLWPYASSPRPSPLQGSTPGFVLSVSPNLDNPVNVGYKEFEIIFSDDMLTTAPLSVTFDIVSPYSSHVVEPVPGWVDSRTWKGSFWIQSDTGDGTNVIRISSAIDSQGFLIPDDVSHAFVIDTSGPGVANNGLANVTGSDITLSWPPYPGPCLGYNVRRSLGNSEEYTRINGSIITTNFYVDVGILPQSKITYIVDVVGLDNHSTQYTNPFSPDLTARIDTWSLY